MSIILLIVIFAVAILVLWVANRFIPLGDEGELGHRQVDNAMVQGTMKRQIFLPALDETARYFAARALNDAGGVEWTMAQARTAATPGVIFESHDDEAISRVVAQLKEAGLHPEVREATPQQQILSDRKTEPSLDRPSNRRLSGLRSARTYIGIGGLLAFVFILLRITNAVSSCRSCSAIQITQVYAEGIFYGAMVLGFVLSAYVLTRTAE